MRPEIVGKNSDRIIGGRNGGSRQVVARFHVVHRAVSIVAQFAVVSLA